jgi:tetratricopeptide (TPR) repeat protein
VTNDLGLAVEMSREAFAFAEGTGLKKTTAWSLFALGTSLAGSKENQEARSILDQALALFTEMNDTWGLARALNWIGILLFREADYERARTLFEQSLELRRQIGNPWAIGQMLEIMAAFSCRLGDYKRAVSLFAESLTIAQELGDKYSIAHCLMKMAGVIGVMGQPLRAVRLYGAAEALRNMIGAHIEPRDRPDYERDLTTIRARLDDATFEAAWAEGRKLTLEQAVADALSERT